MAPRIHRLSMRIAQGTFQSSFGRIILPNRAVSSAAEHIIEMKRPVKLACLCVISCDIFLCYGKMYPMPGVYTIFCKLYPFSCDSHNMICYLENPGKQNEKYYDYQENFMKKIQGNKMITKSSRIFT